MYFPLQAYWCYKDLCNFPASKEEKTQEEITSNISDEESKSEKENSSKGIMVDKNKKFGQFTKSKAEMLMATKLVNCLTVIIVYKLLVVLLFR